MNQYFKNFILCGDIDYHCLLCQESFRSVAHVEKHIRWEKHRGSLKSQTCLPKLKQEHIYKVGKRIYCGICNILIQSKSAICLHVNDENHKINKETPASPRKLIGRYELGFVVVGKMIISPKLWHGVADQQCIVCDTEIDNGQNHMESQEHLINLIQTKVKYEGKHYYREINEDKFQCFTCEKTFPLKTVVDHWTSVEHSGNAGEDPKPEVDHKKVLEDKLIKPQKLFYDIDEDNKVAVCKECKLSVNVNFKDMILHSKDHSESKIIDKDCQKLNEAGAGADSLSEEVVYVEVTDHGKRRAELSAYGKEHFIRLNAGGSKGYCMICDTYLSAHIEVFKEHINGNIHQDFIELKNAKSGERINKELKFKSFIDCILIYLPDWNEFLLNGNHCISTYSMALLSPINDEPQYKKTKCYCCDKYIHHGNEEDHCKTMEHKARVLSAKVSIITTEFIREIRPNTYHCGYCNKIFPYWKHLEKHLESWQHVEAKYYNRLSAKIPEQYTETILPKFEIIPRHDHNQMYAELMRVIYS